MSAWSALASSLLSWTPSPPGWIPLAAVGTALLCLALCRRAERLFQRVEELNRDRLDLLERALDPSVGRSRLEALGMQLDAAAQASVSGRRLATAMLFVQAMVSAEALGSVLAGNPSRLAAGLHAAWLLSLCAASVALWAAVGRAQRAAQESTAHARRYEFLFVSAMRRKSGV